MKGIIMDKVDKRIFKDDYAEANRELINKCIMKLDELVERTNRIMKRLNDLEGENNDCRNKYNYTV